MNYREVTILAEKSLGDTGTETIDLDLIEPLTELVIRFEQRNPSSGYNDYPVERQISKIEIVDGGKSIWSLSGREAVGAVAVDDGHFPYGFVTAHLSYDVNRYIPLRFGRFIGDPDFAFDPSKLRNPQLKVTYAIGGMTTLLNTITVFAKVLSGVPSPSQCLVWRSIREYTSVADATESTELPVDHPYRRIMFRGYADAVNLGSVNNHYKLACDVDRLVLFDVNWEQMYALVAAEFGLCENNFIARSLVGQDIQTFLCPCLTAVGIGSNPDIVINSWTMQGGRAMVQGYDSSSAIFDTDVPLKMTGLNPHNCVFYQFGRKDDPATWFRASQYKSVKATLEHDYAGAVTIAVQQPVNLGS